MKNVLSSTGADTSEGELSAEGYPTGTGLNSHRSYGVGVRICRV